MTNIINRINAIEKIVTPKDKKSIREIEWERKKNLIGLELDKYMKIKKKL